MLLRYAGVLVRATLKSPLVWAATALTAAVLCMGLVIPLYDEGRGQGALSRATYEWVLGARGVTAASPEGVPVDLAELNGRELDAAQRAVDAGTPEGFYAALADFYRVRLDIAGAGYSTEPVVAVRAQAVFTERLVETGYDRWPRLTSCDAPALFYVASAYRYVPSFVLYAVVVAVGFALARLGLRDKLFTRVPLPRACAVGVEAAVAVAVSGLLLAVAWAPAFIWAAVVNGVGTLSYPVVFVRGSEVVSLTLAGLLVHAGGLWAVASTSVFAVCQLVATVVDKASPGAAAAALYASAPFLFASSTGQSFGAVTYDAMSGLLPTTYLDVPSIVGRASNLPWVEVPGVVGLLGLFGLNDAAPAGTAASSMVGGTVGGGYSTVLLIGLAVLAICAAICLGATVLARSRR